MDSLTLEMNEYSIVIDGLVWTFASKLYHRIVVADKKTRNVEHVEQLEYSCYANYTNVLIA